MPEAPMSIEKLDDDTEICIDNLCWDYQGYMNDSHEETEAALDKSRDALRSRIRELIEEARKEECDRLDRWLQPMKDFLRDTR